MPITELSNHAHIACADEVNLNYEFNADYGRVLDTLTQPFVLYLRSVVDTTTVCVLHSKSLFCMSFGRKYITMHEIWFEDFIAKVLYCETF